MRPVLVLLLLFAAVASATQYQDCGSTTGVVSKVDVSDCPDSGDTCVLKRGTKKNLTIGFTSKGSATSVKAVVHGVIKGVPLPFPLPRSDGCKQSGLTCPLQNGQSYTYANVLPIKGSYPSVSVKVKWELRDESGNDIVCVEIPCEIQ